MSVKTSCKVAFLVMGISFVFATISFAAEPTEYVPDADAKPLQIRTALRLVLHDDKRDKDLQLRVIWPEREGPFPVIVWSHGAYGSKDAYLPLTEYWAANGYVVIQPTHSDSVALGNRLGDPKVFQTWQTRPADISFILDSFAELVSKEPALRGRLDDKRIGVGGHSFGANTAQLVGGAKAIRSNTERSYADKRVQAVMLLSGQGPGEMLTDKSWQDVRLPFFVMTGSKDGPTRTGQPAEWRKQPYELCPPGDKFLVWVEGLDHGYGGITGVRGNPKNQENANHVRWTKIVTLPFWDAYLKQNKAARDYLESSRLEELTQGALKVSHK